MGFTIDYLSKSFGDQRICKDFNLELNTGELAMLVGASGSGKTTILRIINDLETADKGNIQVDGSMLIQDGLKVENSDYQKKVGLVFQDYQLFPHMTVLDNIIFAPLMNKLDTKENLIQQAIEALTLFGMEDKIDAYPNILSGGQKQRVAIVRALMLNPSLLCFDEPTSALDALNTEAFADIIKKLRATGMMILIVTHDASLVDQLREDAKIIESWQFIR